MEAQNHLETWAIVELFGHQKEIGFVTTRYYGTACMFQIDVPELPEREEVLGSRQYIETVGDYLPAGSVVKRAAKEARTRLVGVGAIYSVNPCDEATAKAALERMMPRPLHLVRLPENLFGQPSAAAIAEEQDPDEDEDEDDTGGYIEDEDDL